MCLFIFAYGPDLSAFLDAIVNLLEEVSLPTPLRVADRRRVRRLGDEEVRTTAVDPGRAQVTIRRHVIVALTTRKNNDVIINIDVIIQDTVM